MLRLPIIILGLGALCWAWLALPALQTAAGFSNISSRILAGEPFPQDQLERQVAAFAAAPAFAVSYGRMQDASPILRLRELEMAMDRADPTALDARMAMLSASLRGALMFSPSDGLLWTFLYWLDSMREGPSERIRSYLALSYMLTPLEGTVALRRNRFALSNFELLESEIQLKVVSEFAGMVNARFINAIVPNLAGPGWRHRDRLLDGLSDVDVVEKQTLVKMFAFEGVRLIIPGSPEVEERPWRR